ncbi:MAG: M20/M25/M40 family metallo-hydrolase [Planctomycetota bacterium]
MSAQQTTAGTLRAENAGHGTAVDLFVSTLLEIPEDNQGKLRYHVVVMAAMLTDAELLARLVGFDSTSSKSNVPIAEFICDYLDEWELQLVRNYNEDKTKVNLLARIGGKSLEVDNGSGLLLSGHMDVVPAKEPEWKSDPFSLVETADAFIGRGACDMKGFVALAINSLKKVTGGASPIRCRCCSRLTKNREFWALNISPEHGNIRFRCRSPRWSANRRKCASCACTRVI